MNFFMSRSIRTCFVCIAVLSAANAGLVAQTPLSTGSPVRGSVKLPDGQPAGDATVYLLKAADGSYALPTHPKKSITDADGNFSFESVSPSDYQIWAETSDQTSLEMKLRGTRIRVSDPLPTEASEVTLSLHPGCGYDVAVHDAKSSAPIASAVISFGWTDIEREYKTGEDGVSRIRNLAMDDWYFVVRADGYATEFFKTSKQQLGTVLPLRFDLNPGGSIQGVVQDSDGKLVSDAKVSISAADISMSPEYVRIVTNDVGEFSAEGLPIGRPLRLSARKDGYEWVTKTAGVIGTAEPTRVEMVIQKRSYGGDVIVKVLDSNEQPIESATLFNRGNSSSDTRESVTDKTGVGKIQNVFNAYSGCAIVVKAVGYIPQRIPVEPGTIEKPAEIIARLQEGKTLRGRVVKPDETPAPRLRVYYNGGEMGFNDLGGQVTTDDDGRFEIRGLPETSSLTVYVPQEFAPIRSMSVSVGEQEELTIAMQSAAVIRVRAVDAETLSPIAEFNVKIGSCEDRRPGDPNIGGIPTSLIEDGVNVQGTQTEYRLEGQLPGAPYKVVVSAVGYESATVPRVEAQTADISKVLDVPLKKSRPGDYQAVAGRLIDADGQPIVGASVRLLLGSEIPIPATGQQQMSGWSFYHWDLLRRDDIENRDKCVQLLKTVSDGDGRFEFKAVKKDTPWMELFYFGENLMSQRYSNLREFSDADLADLTAQAEKPASITIDIDRKRFANAHTVSVEAADYITGMNAIKLAFSSDSKEISDDGAITFDNLPAGNYTVRLSEKPQPSADGFIMVKGIMHKDVTVEIGDDHVVSF